MGVIDRVLRPVVRRVMAPVLHRQEELINEMTARLERHVLNVSRHQTQLHDENLRRVVDEIRSNTAFLHDSVIAIERAEGRELNLLHAVVSPIVHRVRPLADGALKVLLIELVDGRLVAELDVMGDAVTVVRPQLELALPAGVALVSQRFTTWDGLDGGADLVVWATRSRECDELVDSARRWSAPGATVVFAAPVAVAAPGVRVESVAWFCREGDRYRRAEPGATGDLCVQVWRA